VELVDVSIADGFFLQGARVKGMLVLHGNFHSGQADDASIEASGIKVDLSADFSCSDAGKLRLAGAHIHGAVSIRGRFQSGDYAIEADEIKVGRYLVLGYTLDDRAVAMIRAVGSVALNGAHIDGDLEFSGNYEYDQTFRSAIFIENTHVGGDLIFRNCDVHGRVRANGACIASNLIVSGIFRSAISKPTIWGDNLRVGKDLLLGVDPNDLTVIPFKVEGQTSIPGATVGGHLRLAGSLDISEVRESERYAFVADNLCVDRDVSMTCVAVGGVRMPGSNLGGYFSLAGSYLAQAGGSAIWAANSRVAQVMTISCRKVEGVVAIDGLHVERDLDISGKFQSNDGVSIEAINLQVDFDLSIDCEEIKGKVLVANSHIGRDADFLGNYSFGNSADGIALDATGVRVEQDLEFYPQQIAGQAMLAGAHVSGNLTLQGAHQSLVAELLRVDYTFFCRPEKVDYMNLAFARFKVWELSGPGSEAVRQAQTALRGCVYEAMPHLTSIDVKHWIAWLNRDPLQQGGEPGFSSQPFAQLASVYRTYGHDPEARKVLIAGESNRRKKQSLIYQAWGAALWAVVGYGYRPMRAVGWLLGIILGGAFVINLLPRSDFTVNGKTVTGFNPIVYVVDKLLPFGDVGQQNVVAHGAARSVTVLLLILGWIFVTVVIAAFTNVLRRRDES
jgi:hypothetical protein